MDRSGKLTARVEPPDLVIAVCTGFFSPADARTSLEELKRAAAGLPQVYLIMDLAGVLGVDPRGRKVAAEAMADFPLVATAIVGASFPVRVVVHFISGVGKLLRGRDRPYTFAADEAEARAWLEAQRRGRGAGG